MLKFLSDLTCAFGFHNYEAHTQPFSEYEECRNCTSIRNPDEKTVYDFETHWWQELKNVTGRKIYSLQHDISVRQLALIAVAEYRERLRSDFK